ncbi:hypothetical protein AAG570_004180 [Ranatra chinensis]|uniref:Protein kinase domain-containing protein n=1 Tax=Ranatra chinensis TaxID=642074 RepID=A0ABD0Y3Q5_9HEMI
MQCLHREGIVHGDVRPESLLYQTPSPNSPLKLRDVSLSKLSPSTFTAFYLAPEKGRCKGDGIEEDIWSLGIVLYIMLCGLEPSESGRRLSLCGFSLPWWDDISGSAKELIQQLLEESPENRISASKALQHPWVNGDTSNVHHMPTTVERLKEFNARHKFRAATKAVLATHRLGISPQMKKNAR